MGTLTIRTQPEHDTALVAVGNRLGEKTASQTLLKSLMTYEHHCEEIGVSLDIENYCTIRASPACQRRCLRFLSAL